ncbi:hypothetical protein J2755_000482 [Methanohalophilus levihalophilus]|uniref:hypothetical protein n=1 Tax=Methanohalophilus levihalophilus TaxID=1431282 RepID=UPI001AE30616|nr:hypothetical protein [Methanohalophilus levihalophilus]MBP2029562.1 hypothetical protein [Methanohalophilus levihalophilus]
MNSAAVKIRNILVSIAVFLVIGTAVTEVFSDIIFFSLFLGIPAGAIAGMATFAYLRHREKA